jgi:hypothetical protein
MKHTKKHNKRPNKKINRRRGVVTRKQRKNPKKIKILKNRTPKDILKLSKEIASNLPLGSGIRDLDVNKASSYSPTINDDLVTLKSIPREKLSDCNNILAFQLKEPLKISVPGKLFGKSCLSYDDPAAKEFLLKNLSANKHIDPTKVVPPIQIQSNCWFNTMFVTLFVSDKGRKFFHYFRQLMIEGKQADGSLIPPGLRNAFALLNFAVESSLTGSRYAYEMDTNNVIRQVYAAIPDEYHKRMPYVVKVDEASNPIKYYSSIINYLDNDAVQILFVSDVKTNPGWRERVQKEVKKSVSKPHIIVLEIFDGANSLPGFLGEITNKEEKFTVDDATYELDSCIVRDIEQQHFCATLTIEGKDMAYDGMSFHRMVPMNWRENLNKQTKWKFEGSKNLDGSPLEWSFLHGYQMLIYYRI